ncbi:helicase-related protein [Phytomonospora sp. NPDC050363]|uniref:helicase-related protein n=1 Tax=Phytomonospora sp. NPDC050363 TaxID=3155642 RepID=UPI0033DAFF3F
METLTHLRERTHAATPNEQAVLARWSGWGSLPKALDAGGTDPVYAAAHQRLISLLSTDELAAASASVLWAHFTHVDYTREIWDALTRLGFRGGNVLEPGCGSGNFLATAPENTHLVGVELDPITAEIAGHLHPHARILNEGFEHTRIPSDSLDGVVGNVPYADLTLHDPRHNYNRYPIHNHFIVKGLDLLRPGALMAVLTSRYTLDAEAPFARRDMSAMADLVAAVRLPNGAHQRAAGTNVVSDLLIFQRRDEPPFTDPDWVTSSPRFLSGHPMHINDYFAAHPDHVLGELRLGSNRHRSDLTVAADGDTTTRLREALASITSTVTEVPDPVTVPLHVQPAATIPVHPDGYLTAHPDGTFTATRDGVDELHAVSAGQADELRAMLRLRDAVRAVVTADRDGDGETAVTARTDLTAAYQSYRDTYGPITRDDAGTARAPQGGFRSDPYAGMVLALERRDENDQIVPTDIFTVPQCRSEVTVTTAADALAVCRDRTGGIDLQVISDLLGIDRIQTRQQLGDLVFDDPAEHGRLVTADEYLSGRVADKLAVARDAAAADPRFDSNVAALEAVLPARLAPGEISLELGLAWIPEGLVQEFARELLKLNELTVAHLVDSNWTVSHRRDSSVASTVTWGTPEMPAAALLQKILRGTAIEIRQTIATGTDSRTILDADATAAALEKAEAIKARWREWIWEHPGRARGLADDYYQRAGQTVPRAYNGDHLTFPGLREGFVPHAHQRDAIARIIAEPGVVLAHHVGAGKTAEMIIGMAELKRLGLVSKPVMVVPKGLLGATETAWRYLYPDARLAVPTNAETTGEGRRAFSASLAARDVDCVILTEKMFESMALSPQALRDHIDRELEYYDDLAAQRGKGSGAFKDIQKEKERARQRLLRVHGVGADTARDKRTAGTIYLDETGIDYIVRDEGHRDKNIPIATRHTSIVASRPSNRAADMLAKRDYMRHRYGRTGIVASGTPVLNTISEVYVWLRSLAPHLLRDIGVHNFDDFCSLFVTTRTAVEIAPTGGLRIKTRERAYTNVGELLRLWHSVADVRSEEELGLKGPLLAERADGERRPAQVAVEATPEHLDYAQSLHDRLDAIAAREVDKTEDNQLTILSNSIAAALDLHLVGVETTGTTKVEVAADNIARIHHATAANVYLDDDGQPHPVPGALQFAFADLGVYSTEKVNNDEWDAYSELKRLLIDRGVPADKIAFIHEAPGTDEREAMLDAARTGAINVLIGSTATLGEGVNVQDRAIAMHLLDPKLRPGDTTQRIGRINRPGNQNPEIQIYQYGTTPSGDAYVAQLAENKAGFIKVLFLKDYSLREVTAPHDDELNAAEFKAATSGSPLLVTATRLAERVANLERLQRSHDRTRNMLAWRIQDNNTNLDKTTQALQLLDERLPIATANTGTWELRLGRADHSGKNNVDAALGEHVNNYRDLAARNRLAFRNGPSEIRGAFRDLDFTLSYHYDRRHDIETVTVAFDGIPEPLTLTDPARETSLADALAIHLDALPTQQRRLTAKIQQLRTDTEQAVTEHDKPFAHTAELAAARAELARVEQELGLDVITDEDAKTQTSTTGRQQATPRGTDAAAAVAASRSVTSTPVWQQRAAHGQETPAVSRIPSMTTELPEQGREVIEVAVSALATSRYAHRLALNFTIEQARIPLIAHFWDLLDERLPDPQEVPPAVQALRDDAAARHRFEATLVPLAYAVAGVPATPERWLFLAQAVRELTPPRYGRGESHQGEAAADAVVVTEVTRAHASEHVWIRHFIATDPGERTASGPDYADLCKRWEHRLPDLTVQAESAWANSNFLLAMSLLVHGEKTWPNAKPWATYIANLTQHAHDLGVHITREHARPVTSTLTEPDPEPQEHPMPASILDPEVLHDAASRHVNNHPEATAALVVHLARQATSAAGPGIDARAEPDLSTYITNSRRDHIDNLYVLAGLAVTDDEKALAAHIDSLDAPGLTELADFTAEVVHRANHAFDDRTSAWLHIHMELHYPQAFAETGDRIDSVDTVAEIAGVENDRAALVWLYYRALSEPDWDDPAREVTPEDAKTMWALFHYAHGSTTTSPTELASQRHGGTVTAEAPGPSPALDLTAEPRSIPAPRR